MRPFWLIVFFTDLKAYSARESLFFNVDMWCLKFKAGSKKTPRNFTDGVLSSAVTCPNGVTFTARS